jgi:hypothetical protein
MDPMTMMAMGQAAQGVANVSNAYFNYRNAKVNANFLNYSADLIEGEALDNEEVLKERYEALEGSQIQQYSMAGVAMEGSVLEVLNKTSKVKYKDIANLKIQARRRSSSTRLKASQMKHQARMNLAGSFLGTAGKGMSSYGQMKNTG